MNPPRLPLRWIASGIGLGGFVLVLAALGAASVQSQEPPTPPAPFGSPVETSAPPIIDEARLTAIGPDVRASADEISGGPKMLLAESGALAPAAVDVPAEDVARAFISANADLWALDGSALPALVVERDFTIDGVRNIWFTQEASGVPVFESRIKTAFDRSGALIVMSGAPRDVPKGAPQPARDAEAAAREAMRAVGEPPSELGPKLDEDIDGKLGARFQKGALQAEPTSQLVVFPTVGGPRLAWRASIAPSTTENYDIVIDDATGGVLYKQNRVLSAGPEGEVFVMPNPDPDNGATPVVVPFVGSLPSPHDVWVSGTITAGNNALVGEDTNSDLTPVPAVSVTQQFNFGFTNDYALNQNPLTDLNAAITNAFYWANVAHDFLYGLGFTETVGNYQNDNFALGGAGGDAIAVLVQYGIGTNNASFSGGTDGDPARIMLLLNVPPWQYSDMAFASDVILHEYGHGVHLRTVGGFYGLQFGALGEAWADYLGETVTDDPVMAEHASGNMETGIRRTRQDMSTALYGDMCTVVACEVHRDGETWATTLWDIRRTMIALYGPALGRLRADELYYLGMTLTADAPDFLDARDGIIAADVAYYASANQCYLWNAFATRGMGASAESFGGSSRDTLEAFDLPPSCAGAGPDTDGDGMPDSYEVLHSCLNSAVIDSLANPDVDGEANLSEYALGTDPCVGNASGVATGTTARMNLSTSGVPAVDSDSYAGASSDSGRHIAFTSAASNLAAGDTLGSLDVFVRDRDTDADGIFDEAGAVSTVFVAHTLAQSFDIDISATGRFVSFASNDATLAPGDNNGAYDAFVYDRDSDGDGIFDEVGFTSTARASVSSAGIEGDGHTAQTALNAIGRFVTYTTMSGDLAPGDANKMYDVYIRDRDTDADSIFDEPGFVSTARVSTDAAGTDTNGNSGSSSVSDSGRYVVFFSSASNLVAGDTNGAWDIFVRDRDTDADGVFDEPGFVATKRMSESVAGLQGNSLSFDPDISGNGRYVVFSSLASNLVPGDSGLFADVFVRDRDTDNDGIYDEAGAVSLVRVPVGSEFGTAGRKHFGKPQISRDGRTVVFGGSGVRSNLAAIARGRDVYVYDRVANVTRQVSTHGLGTDKQRNSQQPAVSGDGRYVSFYSSSADLVTGDTNTLWDTFAFDRDDGDGIPWASDNCGADANPLQENSDANFYESSPPFTPASPDDKTNPRSDASGNVCDDDDDNDGLLDATETNFSALLLVCPLATGAINPLDLDTDNDHVADRAECVMGSDPFSFASKPAIPSMALDPDGDRIPSTIEAILGTNPALLDTDGDKLSDGVEFKGWNSDPLVIDTDGESGRDCREVGSLNADTVLNPGDQALLAFEIARAAPPTAKLWNFDINQDGAYNPGDQALLANIIIPGNCP